MSIPGGKKTGTPSTPPLPATAMRALLDLDQSVWLDHLRRGTTRSGELASMVAAGLRGMTSNPTIFEHAIAAGSGYDDAIIPRRLRRRTP